MKDTKLCMESVVKLHCVHTPHNYSQPWNKAKSYSSTGSAFAISGRRLLTNAHCVDHYTQIKVQRLGSDTKYLATALSIGYECDIALLSVEEESFWDGMELVEFGDLPHLQDEVTVVGYPVGGNTISVTSGVVSRIDIATYSYADPVELLRVQIDAAINAGNSGGPAFNSRHECIGIAFESLTGADTDSIGYIIPTPVIQHFLEDYARNGMYTGFPWLGCLVQNMESPHLRAASGMQSHHKGLLIKEVLPCAPIAKIVNAGDVLLRFDGVDITNDGTIPFRRGQRIKTAHLVSKKFVHDTASICVLQSGIEHTYTMQLSAPTYPVPAHTRASPPPYLIVGGLVFTALSLPYLISEYGTSYEEVAPVGLLHEVHNSSKRPCGDQLVVLSQVLAAPITVGYESFGNLLVARLNGQPVRNMQDLARILDSCKQPFLDFDLQGSSKLVLPTEAARSATAEILETHCIATDRSAGLRPAALAACYTCPCCHGSGWDIHRPKGSGAASVVAHGAADGASKVAARQCEVGRGVLDGVHVLEGWGGTLVVPTGAAHGLDGSVGATCGGDGCVAAPVTPAVSEVEFDVLGGDSVALAATAPESMAVLGHGMQMPSSGATDALAAAAAMAAAVAAVGSLPASGGSPHAGDAMGKAAVGGLGDGAVGFGLEAAGHPLLEVCGGLNGWGGSANGSNVIAVMAGPPGPAVSGAGKHVGEPTACVLAMKAGSYCPANAGAAHAGGVQHHCIQQPARPCSMTLAHKIEAAVKLPMKRNLDGGALPSLGQ